jgi:hypothetical protein
MPTYPAQIGSYGTIPIYRYELLSMKSTMSINQYPCQVVNVAPFINAQANQYDYFYLSLRVDAASFILWGDYFRGIPNNLQRDLAFMNTWYVEKVALEKMDVDVEKIVNDGTGNYDYIYKLDLTFVHVV